MSDRAARTDRQRQTRAWTDRRRHADRRTHRQRDKQIDRLAIDKTCVGSPTHSQTSGLTGLQTSGRTGRQTDGQPLLTIPASTHVSKYGVAYQQYIGERLHLSSDGLLADAVDLRIAIRLRGAIRTSTLLRAVALVYNTWLCGGTPRTCSRTLSIASGALQSSPCA